MLNCPECKSEYIHKYNNGIYRCLGCGIRFDAQDITQAQPIFGNRFDTMATDTASDYTGLMQEYRQLMTV